jgi:uncharacterized protein DUF4412
MRITMLSIAAVVFAGSTLSADDLTIVSKQTFKDGAPVTATSYLGSDHARMVTGEGQESIIDLKTGQMTVIDNRKKEYFVITRQDLDQMKARMQEQMNSPEMKRAQEQMKNLPPEMQKKMQNMMGGMAAAVEVKKTGTTRKIAGYTCENWVVTMGQMSRTEQCMTTDLPFPAQSWDAFRDFAEGMKGMASAMGPMAKGFNDLQEKMKAMRGFPLASNTTTTVMGHSSSHSSEVVEIKAGALPASTWAVPAGYTKVESPMAKAMSRH